MKTAIISVELRSLSRSFYISLSTALVEISFLILCTQIPSLIIYQLINSFFHLFTAVLIPELAHRLREVDMDSSFINENSIHFSVSKNALVLSLKLNKCVLQRVASFPVSNQVARGYFAKSRKNKFKVLLLRDWIEFANEKHIFWRLHISVWQILQNCQNICLGLCLCLLHFFLNLLLTFPFHDLVKVDIIIQKIVVSFFNRWRSRWLPYQSF